MSTVLVGILEAGSRHGRQVKRAKLRIAAAKLADALLTGWSRDWQHNVPDAGHGTPMTSGLSWRTELAKDQTAAKSIGAKIVRLEIYETKQADDRQPLVVVEVLKPISPAASPQ